MITSRKNELIKTVKGYSDKKNRDKDGVFTVEGTKLVTEALSFLGAELIVGTEDGVKPFLDKGVKVETVSDQVFLSISSQKTPQGVIAVIKKPEITLKAVRTAVLLDGVTDPANVGAILRTASAVGIDAVYFTEDSCDPYSPKSVRASMGGIFRVPVIPIKRENILSIGLPIIVADMKGENVFGAKIPEKYCLALGNEGNGVSDKVIENAYYTISIPMENNVESLNVAVSCGIILYSIKNQRR